MIFSATVHLSGPKYVRRDDTIKVNCSSDESPIFTSANFFINGRTYTSLRVEGHECYSARVKCPLDSLTCHCGQDGKQYGLLIRASARTTIMTVSCSMRFSKNGKSFTKNDSLLVQIHGKHTIVLPGQKVLSCQLKCVRSLIQFHIILTL